MNNTSHITAETAQSNEDIARMIENSQPGVGAAWANQIQEVISRAPKGAR